MDKQYCTRRFLYLSPDLEWKDFFIRRRFRESLYDRRVVNRHTSRTLYILALSDYYITSATGCFHPVKNLMRDKHE
jgi:hypothetical protein